MAMVMDVLDESQIRKIREEVYKTQADVDRLLKDVHGADGIEIIGEMLKEKFRISFFQKEMNFNQLQALIAIFCNEVYVVHDPVTGSYLFGVAYESILRDNIELDDKESYKLRVIGMEEVENGVTEIDFHDVRRDLMWYAMPNKTRSSRQTKKSFFQKLKAYFRH